MQIGFDLVQVKLDPRQISRGSVQIGLDLERITLDPVEITFAPDRSEIDPREIDRVLTQIGLDPVRITLNAGEIEAELVEIRSGPIGIDFNLLRTEPDLRWIEFDLG